MTNNKLPALYFNIIISNHVYNRVYYKVIIKVLPHCYRDKERVMSLLFFYLLVFFPPVVYDLQIPLESVPELPAAS